MAASRRKVLVIDDDEAFARMACDFLKLQGYEALAATDFDSAVELFRKHRPPVVVLDLNMPLVNGDRFLPLLQEVEPRVKAIVVSGCLAEEVESRFAGLGYFAFLEKGTLSLDTLKETIHEAYDRL